MDYMTSNRRLFLGANYLFLILLALFCLLPIVNVLAVSLSSSTAALANEVGFWPVDFTFKSYSFIMRKPGFLDAFGVSLQRVALGTIVNMVITLITAYPLSKEQWQFRPRTFFAWFFVFTLLFNGGLIPYFLSVKYTGLIDSLGALIIPTALPIFNVILLINFFRGLPKELEESAFMDGAGHWKILWSIYLPLSLPALATVMLLAIVGHWNSWFDGMIFMSSPNHYPLATYLQVLLTTTNGLTGLTVDEVELMKSVSNRTANAAQIFLTALPVLVVYPFLQKFFIKGLVLGSVKE